MVEETIHEGQNQQDEARREFTAEQLCLAQRCIQIAILIAKAAGHKKRSKPFCKLVQSVVQFAISTWRSVETESPLNQRLVTFRRTAAVCMKVSPLSGRYSRSLISAHLHINYETDLTGLWNLVVVPDWDWCLAFSLERGIMCHGLAYLHHHVKAFYRLFLFGAMCIPSASPNTDEGLSSNTNPAFIFSEGFW